MQEKEEIIKVEPDVISNIRRKPLEASLAKSQKKATSALDNLHKAISKKIVIEDDDEDIIKIDPKTLSTSKTTSTKKQKFEDIRPSRLKGITATAEATPAKEGIISRFLSGAGLPSSTTEFKKVAKDLASKTQLGSIYKVGRSLIKGKVPSLQEFIAAGNPAGDVYGGLIKPQLDELKEAYDKYKKHNNLEALGHFLAGVTPLVGPMTAQLADKGSKALAEGDYATASGSAAMLALTVFGAREAKKLTTKAPTKTLPGAGKIRPLEEVVREQGREIKTTQGIDPVTTKSTSLPPPRLSQPQTEGGGTGAGARTTGRPLPTSPIGQLGSAATGASTAQTPSVMTPLSKLPNGINLSNTWTTAKQTLSQMLSSYTKGAYKWNDMMDAVGTLGADKGTVRMRATGFAHEVVKAFPDKAKRDALNRYAAAESHALNNNLNVDDVLNDWASRSTGNNKIGYENALKLNNNEKLFVDNTRTFYEEMYNQASSAGLLSHAIDNYIRNVVKKGPTGSKLSNMIADAQASLLNPNFKPARQRIFPNMFEGEQKGYIYNSDIAENAASYYTALGDAIASRNYLSGLSNMVASDGRPAVAVSGIGKTILDPLTGNRTTFIKPDIKYNKDIDLLGYKPIDNYAFKGWKWGASNKQTAGSRVPITESTTYFQGDLLVHPEFVKDIRARFEPSFTEKLSTRIPGTQKEVNIPKGILKAQGILKGTLFSLTPFHHVTEGFHALGHWINPLPSLVRFGDWHMFKSGAPLSIEGSEGAAIYEAMKGGLQLAGGHGQELFAEGAGAEGSLINKIPVVGAFNRTLSHDLFSVAIPKLKYETYKHILKRNLNRYGPIADRNDWGRRLGSKKEYTREQLVSMSADQANAAYGELNYLKLARSKSYQDLTRILFLAPDFFEARARFAFQAIKGGGREQFQAIARLIGFQWGIARIVNYVSTGDPKLDRKDFFKMYIGGKRYSLRSVPADIVHAIEDLAGFIDWRLNPFFSTPIIELLTRSNLRKGIDIGSGKWELKEKQSGTKTLEKIPERAISIGIQRPVTKAVENIQEDKPILDKLDIEALHSMFQAIGLVELKEEEDPNKRKSKGGPKGPQLQGARGLSLQK